MEGPLTLKEKTDVIDVKHCRLIHQSELEAMEKYFRAANYLSAAQLYLKDNFLMRQPLKTTDIKDRLLGHWGTVPGINLIYTHLNRLIRAHDLDLFLVTGPGHGAPGILSNLYLENTLHEFFPDLTRDYEGLCKFIKRFSWPEGFPSHLYPGIPGTINEGGELGYALATAYGAVMDNPHLIVACLIGDGEAETGPTAAAWHSPKFIDPTESGAVLPILHLNGYKISNPTIFGTMDNQELTQLFEGYGYYPKILDQSDLHAALYATLDWAYAEILAIQHDARTGKPRLKPKWPLIILRSLKGWTGIKEINGIPIEGSFRSHQIPAADLKKNPKSLELVENWLRSYHPETLFDKKGSPIQEILETCPKGKRRMGINPHTFGGDIIKDLALPSIDLYAVSPSEQKVVESSHRGSHSLSNMVQLSEYLKYVVAHNPHNFRIFSPDELESNKMGSLLDVTHKNYQWPTKPYDGKISRIDGRVIEILSEHCCQGWLQGYLMTGRHGLFPSYEAFLNIITSMMGQFAKFLKYCRETSWRRPFSSLNYLETSTLWRQEHNGFSHQYPGFINALLNLKANIVRIYLPPDANCLISTVDHCLQSKGYVNLVVASKHEMPQWLTMEEAIAHCRAGASVWQWASTDEGVDPDIVLAGIGDVTHLEVMAAAHILRHEIPKLRVRVVNITDLLILEKETIHPHGLDDDLFTALFTKDKPVIINFHGYPSAVKQLLYGREQNGRFHINGYLEEGTTTTPFDMLVRNKASRFHLILQSIKLTAPINSFVASQATALSTHYAYILEAHRSFIKENGKDPDEIMEWRWN